MDVPLVTIGIAYYKAADTIEKAVASALAQTWDNTEIIIVDDASDDGAEALLSGLEKQHENVRVVHLPENKGVAGVRNEIIAQARGDFIAFFDDDDESLPERLEKQYQRITDYEAAFADGKPVICHAARVQRYPDGQERIEQTKGTGEGCAPNGEAVALRILTGKPSAHVFGSGATCSQMARSSTYRELGGFDENFRRSEDTELNVRAALAGAHFAGIAEPLVRQTMTLASDKKLEDEKLYALQLLDKYQGFIDRHSAYAFCREWVIGKYDFLQKHRMTFVLRLMKLCLTHPVLSAQRLIWAWPNIGFNLRFVKFHHEQK